MTGITAVLFDAGGTLIHVDGQTICETAGVPYSEDRFQRAEAMGHAQAREWFALHPLSTDAERLPVYVDRILLGLGLEDRGKRDTATRRLAARHEVSNLWSRPGEGAAKTLGALRARGYRLGVVSNSNGHVEKLLETAGLSGFLEVIIDSSKLGVEKPDPRIFHAATTRMHVEPRECAYVGDIYEIDAIGARAAGLSPVLIGGTATRSDDGIPRIARLAELLALFPGPVGPRAADSPAP